MLNRHALIALPILALLGGCVQGPQPVLSLADQTCPPGTNRSQPLVPTEYNKPGGGNPSGVTIAEIRADTSCAEIDGRKTTIALVSLPEYVAPYRLTLSSVVSASGAVWPPNIQVQDVNRVPLRTIPFDMFKLDNQRFLIEFFPKANERFLLLSTDMTKLGTTGSYMANIEGTASGGMMIGSTFVAIPGTPSRQETRTYQFSHNGTLRTVIQYMEHKNLPANAP
ncbi:hypothetical protein ACFSM5_13660 [Lacibacterium aquatile]|uniref:Type VI secretion system lipoprotein TssJ n=1 Tax=Lacibacterium aquatile TaxID=1168082 RepID=A0ABW5DTE8_9PROT